MAKQRVWVEDYRVFADVEIDVAEVPPVVTLARSNADRIDQRRDQWPAEATEAVAAAQAAALTAEMEHQKAEMALAEAISAADAAVIRPKQSAT